MNNKFYEKYFVDGFSWKSRDYIRNSLLANQTYVNKFMLKHSGPIETDEFLLGEATDTEMCLFVMEWSLNLRVIGTYNRRRNGWCQDDDRIRELINRLNDLEEDLLITKNHIDILLRDRFQDQLESLQKDSGLINRPYSKSQLYDVWHKGYVFAVRNGNQIVVFNQYPAGGD